MTSVGWLTRWLADVPADDGWLSPGEREVLAGLRVEKRRRDWRLGRFAAKTAAARWLGVPISRVEIVAAPDGAPEARLDGEAARSRCRSATAPSAPSWWWARRLPRSAAISS